MSVEQLQAIKDNYTNMDWDGFRENAGDLLQREIDIYDAVVIEGVPALIAEVERLTEETLKQKVDKMHLIVDKDYEKSQKQEYIKTVHLLNEENKRLRALIEELAGDTAEHTAQVLRKTRQVRKGESNE